MRDFFTATECSNEEKYTEKYVNRFIVSVYSTCFHYDYDILTLLVVFLSDSARLWTNARDFVYYQVIPSCLINRTCLINRASASFFLFFFTVRATSLRRGRSSSSLSGSS